MLLSILLFLGNLNFGEIAIIIFAIVLLFGAKKIPELMRGFGKGIREFKDATREVQKNIEDSVPEEKKQ